MERRGLVTREPCATDQRGAVVGITARGARSSRRRRRGTSTTSATFSSTTFDGPPSSTRWPRSATPCGIGWRRWSHDPRAPRRPSRSTRPGSRSRGGSTCSIPSAAHPSPGARPPRCLAPTTLRPKQVAALSPEALDDAVADAPEAFAAARDLEALAAVKPAHLGDRAPVLLARRELGALPPAGARRRRQAGQRGPRRGPDGLRRAARRARGRARRPGAGRGARRRHAALGPHARAAPGTRSPRSPSGSPTSSSAWATRSPTAPSSRRSG